MPQDDMKRLEEKVSDQGHRIRSLEDHIKEVLPPLLDKFDNTASRMHELSISINDLVNKIGSQSKDTEKLDLKFNKLEDKHNKLKEEVVENRILAKAVKGLGSKLLWTGFVVVGAAISVILAVKA